MLLQLLELAVEDSDLRGEVYVVPGRSLRECRGILRGYSSGRGATSRNSKQNFSSAEDKDS